MKKYFAKYLPVEGKIKKGDKYYADLGAPDREVHTAKEDDPKGDYHLVKLFFCSKDIKVGEKVKTTKDSIHWFEDVVDEIKKNGYLTDSQKDGGSGYFYAPNQIFKIIGEVSPDVLEYVKEGDEFDESQIQFIYALPVKKEFRNGEVTKNIKFAVKPEKWLVEEKVTYWAEHEDFSGHNSGFTLKFDIKDLFIESVKIKCPWGHFH